MHYPPTPTNVYVMAEREDEGVFRITHARTPLSQEIVGRRRRYLFSMGIRTACFLGAIVAHGWLRWVLLVGAVILPYVAVVVANAGRENDEPGPGPVPPDLRSLGPGGELRH